MLSICLPSDNWIKIFITEVIFQKIKHAILSFRKCVDHYIADTHNKLGMN